MPKILFGQSLRLQVVPEVKQIHFDVYASFELLSLRLLDFQTPSMQEGLGIAIGLLETFKDQITCGLIGIGIFVVWHHWLV